MKSLVIINPKSGDYSTNRFITDFTIKKPAWLTTDILLLENKFVEKLIESTVKDYDSVIIAGGDGTISKIASIISRNVNPPPFAVIPIGTGNDFSRSSGWFNVWNNGKFDSFFHYLRDAMIQPIDMWNFNGKKFICYVSMGWDAEVVGLYTQIKQKFKKISLNRRTNTLLYIYCALLKLSNFSAKQKRHPLIISDDNHSENKKILFNNKQTLIFSNINSYAGGSVLHNFKNENDGKIDVFYIKNPLEYISFMLKGKINMHKKMSVLGQWNNLDISGKMYYDMQTDGEWEGENKEEIFSFKHSGKINSLIPNI